MNIGLALKVGRAAMGLSAKDLARLSGVAQPTIVRVENGSNPTLDTINKLFAALDKVEFVETDDVLTVNIRLYPTDEQFMAALGPCGK
jgi:predicted transcriptional regulator